MNKIITLISLLYSLSSLSQEQLLDTSFGTNNGITKFTFYNQSGVERGDASLSDCTKLPDGKMLCVGVGLFARFTSNGILDTTFNTTGYKVFTNLGNYFKIKPTINGHYIIMDIAYGGKIAKIDADGNFISNFNIYEDQNTFVDFELDILGNIFLLKSRNNNYSLSKLTNNGIIDTTFGTNGVVELGNTYRYSWLKLNNSGEIFLSGSQSISNTNVAIVVTKLSVNNTIDTSFGTNGSFIHNTGNIMGVSNKIEILDDGKILGANAGTLCNGSNCYGLIIYRLLPNGTLDTTFRGSGISVIPVQSESAPSQIEILDNNSFIIAGTGIRSMYALKFDANGNLDNSFGVNGRIITPQLSSDGYPAYNRGFLIYDNSIILNGVYSLWYASSLRYSTVLRKYNFTENMSITNPQQRNVILYPNPAKDELNINSFNQIESYKIYNVNGSLIEEKKIINSEKIDVSNLNSGIYFIRLEEKFKSNYYKFIKQ